MPFFRITAQMDVIHNDACILNTKFKTSLILITFNKVALMINGISFSPCLTKIFNFLPILCLVTLILITFNWVVSMIKGISLLPHVTKIFNFLLMICLVIQPTFCKILMLRMMRWVLIQLTTWIIIIQIMVGFVDMQPHKGQTTILLDISFTNDDALRHVPNGHA